MDVKKEFGEKVKSLRLEKGWSQEKLALLADLDRTYIPGIEKGDRNVSITVIKKIADALKVDITEFTARVATILVEESIEFDLDTLDTYVKATFPDLRKCINMVQMNSIDGALKAPSQGDQGSSDYKIQMVELFKAGKISQARKLVCGQARPEEMEEIYRWLYDNVVLFGSDEAQEKAILIKTRSG